MEGISLLAYNIAWLGRTQGMKDDFKHWEDVCPLGRNLYRLLIALETHRPQRVENPLDKDITTAMSSKTAVERTLVGFGQLSHATSHSYLNLAENLQHLSGWTLTPTKIVDELKAFLLAEQQAQEWDVLNQKEWEDMETMIAEDPITVGGKRLGDTEVDDARRRRSLSKNVDLTPSLTSDLPGREQPERRHGTSGWTKLKSRTEE